MTAVVGEYQKMWAFLRRLLRAALLLLALFFAVAVATHFILVARYNDDPANMQQQIAQLTALFESKDVIDEAGRLSAGGLFCNNLIATGMSVLLGLVPFLFVPLGALALNASVIGMLSAIMAASGQGGLYEILVAVAPHGVFEIPALLLGAAMGCTLCLDISARILYKQRPTSFLELLFEMARLSVLVVVPLLALAAVIEAYLTPALVVMLL